MAGSFTIPPLDARVRADLRMAIERRTYADFSGPLLVGPDEHGAREAIERRMVRD